MAVRGVHQILDGKLPLRLAVLALGQFCDVVTGITERDQLTAAGQEAASSLP